MITINDYIKKCQLVNAEMLKEQQRIAIENEYKIVNLNKNQFTDGLGSDDKELFNTDRRFTGFYRSGALIGQRYDFFDTGKFIRGLFIKFTDIDSFIINSTGTDTQEGKYEFFQGYTNLFGLDSEYRRVLNYEIIYPELMDFIKKYL